MGRQPMLAAIRLPLAALLLVLLLLVATAPAGVGASCLVDPSTDGFLLPVLVVPGYGMCPRGYLCPNSVVTNTSTYPRYCPATDACLQMRLDNEFCEPQGTYEPYVCPAGWYCPTAYEKVICPSGYFCPLGSTAPRKCPPISQCDEGTGVVYDYGSLLLVGVLDIVFLVVHMRIRRQASLAASRCMPAAVAKVDEANWDGMSEEERTTLCDAIGRRRGQMTGMEFAFSDLSVTIPAKDGQEEKVVLRSVDGTLRPGQVTAVMGPSGAGKTVFFTALLSKLESSWHTTGTLQINGQGPEAFERFRHVIGYVAQDDTLHQELSVEDNVWYSSEVRLPRAFPPEERAALRAAALKAFGATGMQHMIASTLSGSQRKKCSIAVEVASAPSALFLDEPTSALDATAALDLCKGLTSLATQSNMTVVMVIHQPRVEIWNGLDQVLFLAPGGFTVYQGPKSRAEAYFSERLGFQFGLGNPADIIIDGIAEHRDRCIEQWILYLQQTTVASPTVTPAPLNTTATSPQSARNGAATTAAVDMFQEMTSRQPLSSLPSLHQLLGEDPADTAAGESDWRSLLDQQPSNTVTPPLASSATSPPLPVNPRTVQQRPSGDAFPPADEPASFAKQLMLSHNRSIQKQSTILPSVMLDLLLCMVAAAVMASAAVQTRYVGILHAPYALISPKHIAYLLPMLAMFYQIAVAATTSVTSLRSFMGERECYWREMATGGHDRLAYYCGTAAAELYRLVLTSLHFAVVAYFMFQPLQSFWEFYVVILLIFIGFDAQASMLSMVLRPSSAPLMVTVAGVFVALLNGYPKIPGINYVGFTYYITEAFMVQEIAYTNGLFNEPVLDQYEVDRKGLDFAITVLIIAIYRVVGFLLMKFANRDKQR